MHLVHLLDSWTTSPAGGIAAAEAATGHSALWHAATAACSLVHLHHDRVDDALELLLLSFELIFFCQLILVKPVQGVLHCFLDLFLVARLELVLQLLLTQGVPHREAVVLQ